MPEEHCKYTNQSSSSFPAPLPFTLHSPVARTSHYFVVQRICFFTTCSEHSSLAPYVRCVSALLERFSPLQPTFSLEAVKFHRYIKCILFHFQDDLFSLSTQETAVLQCYSDSMVQSAHGAGVLEILTCKKCNIRMGCSFKAKEILFFTKTA